MCYKKEFDGDALRYLKNYHKKIIDDFAENVEIQQKLLSRWKNK